MPGADTNPYLAASAVLAASLDDIINKIEPPASSDGKNPYEQQQLAPLPRNLPEALETLKQDEVLVKYLGEEFITNYTSLLMAEWERFQTYVTNWELDEYFELF